MLNEYLKSINKTKEDLMEGEYEEKQYQSYVINRCLSGSIDTLFQANEMNRFPFLDKRIQYDYLRASIRSANRFSPWIKQEKNEQIEAIQQYFQYNRKKAEETLAIMSKTDIDYIIMSLNPGGFEKTKTKTKRGKNKEI